MKRNICLSLMVCLSLMLSEASAVSASEGENYPKASQRKYSSKAHRYEDSSVSYPKAKKHNAPLLKTDLNKTVKSTPVESYVHSSYGQTSDVFDKEHHQVEDKTGKQTVFSDDHSKISEKLSVKSTSHSSISRTKTNLDNKEKIGVTDRGSLDNRNTGNNREIERKLEKESDKVKNRMDGPQGTFAGEHIKIKNKLSVKNASSKRKRQRF